MIHITWQTGLIIICLGVAAFALLIQILCDREMRKPLDKPAVDERDWSANYIKDYKRWTARR